MIFANSDSAEDDTDPNAAQDARQVTADSQDNDSKPEDDGRGSVQLQMLACRPRYE